jgi:hypothetical protein
LHTLLQNYAGRRSLLKKLDTSKNEQLLKVLSEEGILFPTKDLASLTKKAIEKALADLRAMLGLLIERVEQARVIGRYNTERFLSLPQLDVYVATSMRDPIDFENQRRFTDKVFGHSGISTLKLRYFDPTLSYVDDRVTKGLVECLMLQRAAVTIYSAGETDTMGKDSELAATLAQGKPVIVYVPTGSQKLDTRAEAFRTTHPLGLQIDHETGVAHGIIVVRTPERCAEVLRAVLLRKLVLSIRHEGGIYHLDEETTQSTIRVVSDDSLLTHTFWVYFKHAQDPATANGKKEIDNSKSTHTTTAEVLPI